MGRPLRLRQDRAHPLDEYRQIIADIDQRVHQPSKQSTMRDVLGRADKIFLSRAGKMDSKNIILTRPRLTP